MFNWHIKKTKRAYKMKQKPFFIIFKRLSLKQKTNFYRRRVSELNVLISIRKRYLSPGSFWKIFWIILQVNETKSVFFTKKKRQSDEQKQTHTNNNGKTHVQTLQAKKIEKWPWLSLKNVLNCNSYNKHI